MPKNCECEHSSHYSTFFEMDMGCSGFASVVWDTRYGKFHVCEECNKNHPPPMEYIK